MDTLKRNSYDLKEVSLEDEPYQEEPMARSFRLMRFLFWMTFSGALIIILALSVALGIKVRFSIVQTVENNT